MKKTNLRGKIKKKRVNASKFTKTPIKSKNKSAKIHISILDKQNKSIHKQKGILKQKLALLEGDDEYNLNGKTNSKKVKFQLPQNNNIEEGGVQANKNEKRTEFAFGAENNGDISSRSSGFLSSKLSGVMNLVDDLLNSKREVLKGMKSSAIQKIAQDYKIMNRYVNIFS